MGIVSVTTRQVKIYLTKYDGTPWAGKTVEITLDKSTYNDLNSFPIQILTTGPSDEDGLIDVDLWCNVEGVIPTLYSAKYPDGKSFQFRLVFGDGTPININVLRQAGIAAASPSNPLYAEAQGLVSVETAARIAADADLQQQIDDLGSGGASDFASLTGTLSDLQHGPRSGDTLHAVATTSVAGFLSATDKSKLNGIASGATQNATDAFLLARANHTGTQLANTISDFSTAADARVSAGISAIGLTSLATLNPAAGVATFLATPSSANLLAAITDETGSGALVFATSPTLTTPVLGVATATSLGLSSDLSLASASLMKFSTDLILSRAGAANLRFGAPDAAAPVPQSLSSQSVVAGTSNTAGADFTVNGSQGTGTGAGGRIIFRTAGAGSTGSSQNALVAKVTVGPGTALQPALTLQDTDTGWYRNSAGQWTFASTGTNALSFIGGTIIRISGGAAIHWASGDSITSGDLFLTRFAPANLHLGAADAASPVAQTLGVQNVAAGASNVVGADWTRTGSQGTGTGAGGAHIWKVAPAGLTGSSQNALAEAFRINPTKEAVFSGIPKFAGTNTTGAGSAALGANSPATTNTAPYTWIQATAADGSTVYIPAWK